MAYRFIIDSTKQTIARYPGAHDVLMDKQTGQAAALCLHYDNRFPSGAYSWAPEIQEALEAAIRKPLYLTDEETRAIVNALNGAGAFTLASEISHLRGIIK